MSIVEIILDFILNPWFVISLIFWLIVALAIYLLRKRKGAYSFFFPLLALFKTKKLNNFIRKISQKNPRFWRIFWNIGIFVSFGFIIYALYFFFTNFINLIIAPSIEQALVPVIPGLTIDLPVFLYLLLPLLFTVTTHEFAHGISSSIDGIEIKSTGILGVGLFYLVGFGAFVEVDEWELNSSKYNRNTRFRIAAAGTYVNAITAGIAFLLLIGYPLLVSPFYKQVTQIYNVLTPEKGGFNYGVLQNGDAIIAIKEQNQSDDKYIYLDELEKINLNSILNNKTTLSCSVGENLTFKVYNSFSDTYLEKNVVLGPRYNIIKENEKESFSETPYNLTIRYERASNTEIRITYNYTNEETVNILINKINGTAINYSNNYTLEKYLRKFNLKSVNLGTNLGKNYTINLSVIGVFIGVQSTLFWMHKNDFAKFFTANWADFWQKEIGLLFVISFSLVIFNMLPLPVFDGGRMVKELIEWIFGKKYGGLTKKKKDRFIYKSEDTDCNLSKYRVEKIESVKIELKDKSTKGESTEIILGESNYELIDKIGDGYYDTVSIKLPDNPKIEEDTVFEISYEYFYDEKEKTKKNILNTIQIITLIVVIGNFILSFINFGLVPFWI